MRNAKYSVEPSNNPSFNWMVTVEYYGHENIICYVNKNFQQDKSIAFAIRDLLNNKKFTLDLTI